MTQKLLGNLNISRQDSFGTITASWRGVPMASETVAHTIDQLPEANMRGRFGESPTFEGQTSIAGDITFNPHPIEIGHFLLMACGREVATTQVGSGVTVHDFSPNPTAGFDDGFTVMTPYTFSIDRDQALAWQIADVQLNTLQFTINQNELVSATVGIVGRENSLDALVTPTYRAPNSVWAYHQASVSVAGADAADFVNLVIDLNRNIEGIATLDNSKVISRYGASAEYEVRVSGSVDFRTQSLWEDFRAQGEAQLSINIAMNATSGPTLNIIVPKFKYSTVPINVDGAGRTMSDFTGRGEFDTTSNTAIIYQLTNSLAAAYTAD